MVKKKERKTQCEDYNVLFGTYLKQIIIFFNTIFSKELKNLQISHMCQNLEYVNKIPCLIHSFSLRLRAKKDITLTKHWVVFCSAPCAARCKNTELHYLLFLGLGADRWQNGADVIVDYNTADPLIRWDSYQNICDGEGTVNSYMTQKFVVTFSRSA